MEEPTRRCMFRSCDESGELVGQVELQDAPGAVYVQQAKRHDLYLCIQHRSLVMITDVTDLRLSPSTAADGGTG